MKSLRLASKPISYTKYSSSNFKSVDASVVTEESVSLSVNGKIWLTFMCTPNQLIEQAIGFLFNEAVINSLSDILHIELHPKKTLVDAWLVQDVSPPSQWKRTSGCTGGYSAISLEHVSPVNNQGWKIQATDVQSMMRTFFETQEIYQDTRGIHASALVDKNKLWIVCEDVGRHNTFDKLAGKFLLEEIELDQRLLLTTGRISSEMLLKAARMEIEMIISRTSPTSMSIEMANKLGITLLGYARGSQFNIYAHPERIAEIGL